MPPSNSTKSSALNFKLTKASTLLDLFRGLAAVLVLVEHWRNMLFVDYSQLEHRHLFMMLPYIVSGAGHQAVIIFFILSGYLISGTIFRSLRSQRWSWASYLTHRLVRLWVVLLPGLALCAVWDFLAIHLRLAPALYAGLVDNHEIPNVTATLTLKNLIGNVFFLQTIAVPVFGSDQALWSLANEFWYYLLFPLVLLSFRRRTPNLERGLYVVIFIGVAWLVKGSILALFPVWLLGVLLARVKPPLLTSKVRNGMLICYIPMVFILAKVHLHSPLLDDYLFATLTFIAIWVLLADTTYEPQNSTLNRWSRELAKFSYTLYVVHMPFCLFLTATVVGGQRWVPNVVNATKGLAILMVTAGYAYAIGLLTEAHTDSIRKWIEKKLNLGTMPSSSQSNVRS